MLLCIILIVKARAKSFKHFATPEKYLHTCNDSYRFKKSLKVENYFYESNKSTFLVECPSFSLFVSLFPNFSNTAKPIELKLSQKIPFGRQMVLDKKSDYCLPKKPQKNCLLARSSFPLFLFIRE